MIQRIVWGKFRKAVKLERRDSYVIVVGENLTEIRPPLALVQNWRFCIDVTHREWLFRKIVFAKFHKAVKLENRKSIVIVGAEIWQKSAHRWRLCEIVVLAKMWLIGSDDSEK